MKALTKWLPEALLGALLLAGVLLLALPRRSPGGGQPSPAAASAEPPAERSAPAPTAAPKAASPAQVAALLGWVQPAGSPPAAPRAPPKPTEAVWLKPVGFVIGEGGAPSYVFKDTKANAVITLVPKVENKGWLLREIREKEFLLVYKGTEYVVKRNE